MILADHGFIHLYGKGPLHRDNLLSPDAPLHAEGKTLRTRQDSHVQSVSYRPAFAVTGQFLASGS